MIQIKDSGIEWIGEIPQDWDKRKLKYIAKVETGGTPPRGDDSNFDDEYGIQWIKPDNILENNTISATKEKVSIEAAKNLPIISKGSTVVCCIGTVGKCAYVSEKSVSNQQINAVTFCDEYDSRYGFYSTLISKQEYEAQANKVVVSILNKFQQSNIFYPYCKINKQQNIADYLDKKCSEIDTCLIDVNKSIAKLQEYKKSIITEAVTKGIDPNAEMKDSGVEWIGEIPKHWKTGKVNYAYEVILGKMLQPSLINENDTLEKYLCAVNIQNGNISVDEYKQMWLTIKEKQIYALNEGDLMVVEGGNIADCAILKYDYSNVYFQNSLHRVRQNKFGCNIFLYYWLSFVKSTGYIDLICNKATIAHFTKDKFINLQVAIFDKIEQQQIADYLDNKCAEIDNVIEGKKELANKLKEYKNSLIYECVTGKREVG